MKMISQMTNGIDIARRYRCLHISFNDRICQFRIMENQPHIVFEECDHLEGSDRGGFGSTGTK